MKKSVIGITIVGKDREGEEDRIRIWVDLPGTNLMIPHKRSQEPQDPDCTNFAFSKNGNIETRAVNQNVIEGVFGMYLERARSPYKRHPVLEKIGAHCGAARMRTNQKTFASSHYVYDQACDISYSPAYWI